MWNKSLWTIHCGQFIGTDRKKKSKLSKPNFNTTNLCNTTGPSSVTQREQDTSTTENGHPARRLQVRNRNLHVLRCHCLGTASPFAMHLRKLQKSLCVPVESFTVGSVQL
jgi:hypothetical protein